MDTNNALQSYLLRLGDNALIQGHRLSEWCSRAPMLEEDIALSNLALDQIGRAQLFLEYAGKLLSTTSTADELAFHRNERQYYNALITELPIGNFAFTIARQLYMSAFEELLFEALTQSTDADIAAVATKALKEARYHFSHASDWCVRLGLGTPESHDKLNIAVNELWSYTSDLFEMTDGDLLLMQSGIVPDLQVLQKLWNEKITRVLMRAGIPVPKQTYQHTGSREGIHTEHLGHLLCEMQYLQRAYPEAVW